jgi:hypothetical protein
MNYTEGQSVPFSSLLGKTLASIEGNKGSEKLVFTDKSGNVFRMLHHQDCCEGVDIEDIAGDFNDIVGSEILLAEEVTSDDTNDEYGMWTFYKLSTVKGHVTIRWYGSSEYYSVSVSFEFSHKIPTPLEKLL